LEATLDCANAEWLRHIASLRLTIWVSNVSIDLSPVEGFLLAEGMVRQADDSMLEGLKARFLENGDGDRLLSHPEKSASAKWQKPGDGIAASSIGRQVAIQPESSRHVMALIYGCEAKYTTRGTDSLADPKPHIYTNYASSSSRRVA
jgi:hypothetical protein